MFDSISFSELIMILLIALVVFGPQRLPGLARKAGRWVAEIRRSASEFRRGLDREVQELNAPLREVSDELKGVVADIKQTDQELRGTVKWIGPTPAVGPKPEEAAADQQAVEDGE